MKMKEEIKTEMYGVVTRWQSSGMKQKEFCRCEGISYYKFKYWKTRFAREQCLLPRSTNKEEPGSFIPVLPAGVEGFYRGIELTYPNGVKLSFSQDISVHSITNLVKLY